MSSTGYETELFVISDLHIGGKPSDLPGDRGFRINTHVDTLTEFIEEIVARARVTGRRTELVINGDFIDFLAEEVPSDGIRRSFIDNQQDAVETFDAIAARERPLFDALCTLLASGIALTIVLGNHDIELSLPAVRARLAALLRAGHQANYRFVYDGEAYTVGDVLIEHGNRYDEWNQVDFDGLRELRSACSRDLQVTSGPRVEPPAGSELVIRVMNPIKQDYPFIDLLKPETDAALPLLLTLEPSFANAMNSIEMARLEYRTRKHGLIAPAQPRHPSNISSTTLDPLHKILTCHPIGDQQDKLRKLIAEAQRRKRASDQKIASGVVRRALSFLQLTVLTPDYDDRLKLLLETLRELKDDRSFSRTHLADKLDKNYHEAAIELAKKGRFKTILFGHTHLAKDINLAQGTKDVEARYLNTGTWADLIRVPPEIIHGSSETAREKLVLFAQAIRDKKFDEYLLFQPTFAHICLDSESCTVAVGLYDYKSGIVQRL